MAIRFFVAEGNNHRPPSSAFTPSIKSLLERTMALEVNRWTVEGITQVAMRDRFERKGQPLEERMSG
jgi:hypothetical protein